MAFRRNRRGTIFAAIRNSRDHFGVVSDAAVTADLDWPLACAHAHARARERALKNFRVHPWQRPRRSCVRKGRSYHRQRRLSKIAANPYQFAFTNAVH